MDALVGKKKSTTVARVTGTLEGPADNRLTYDQRAQTSNRRDHQLCQLWVEAAPNPTTQAPSKLNAASRLQKSSKPKDFMPYPTAKTVAEAIAPRRYDIAILDFLMAGPSKRQRKPIRFCRAQ